LPLALLALIALRKRAGTSPPEKQESVLEYVERCRKEGHADADVEKALLAAGWSPKVVTLALSASARARDAPSHSSRRRAR
ncbi:hypothetical protein J4439_00900, partial [Candidatus Woesearchaeota archaeon]|nr:hypothetical protein [Candidatus Woesearchaeota archaeon]